MAEVHVRYEGQSMDFSMIDLDVGDLSTDQQIRRAVAGALDQPATKFDNFMLDRNAESGDVTLRPQAVFG